MTDGVQEAGTTMGLPISEQDPQQVRVSATRRRSRSEKCSEFLGAGWVYLLRIVDGPTKIGMTCGEDPYGRLYDIDQGLPYKTELVAVSWVRDVNRLEKQLHAEYAHKRVKGEWLSLDDADLKRLIAQHYFMLPDRIKEYLAWLVENEPGWRKGRRP